jgi:hypothetical protein
MLLLTAYGLRLILPASAQPKSTTAPAKKESAFKGWNLYRIPWGMLIPAIEAKLPPLTDGGEAEILGVQTKYSYWDSRLEGGRSISHGFYFVDGKLALYSKAYDAGQAATLDDPPIKPLFGDALKRYGAASIVKPNTAVWLKPAGAEDTIVELLLAEVKEPATGQVVRLYRMMYYGPNFPGLDRIRWAKGVP